VTGRLFQSFLFDPLDCFFKALTVIDPSLLLPCRIHQGDGDAPGGVDISPLGTHVYDVAFMNILEFRLLRETLERHIRNIVEASYLCLGLILLS